MALLATKGAQPQISRESLIADLGTMFSPQQILQDEENQRPFECDGLAVYKQMPWLVRC